MTIRALDREAELPPSEAHPPQAQRMRTPERTFWWVFALTCLVRIGMFIFFRPGAFVGDAGDYVQMARQMHSGLVFLPYWPPGLPLFLELVLRLGVSDAGLRLAMLFFWLLAAVSLYRLVTWYELLDDAWVVLLVFGLAPASIQFSLDPLTQLPTAALLLAALSAAVRCLSPRASRLEWALLGLWLGWLALTRPSALVLLLLVPVFCGWCSRRFGSALLALALGLCAVGGWVFAVHAGTGHWTINTSNGKNLWYGNNAWTPNYRTWYFGSHAKLGSEEIKRFPQFEAVMARVDRLPPVPREQEYRRLASLEISSHPATFLLRTLNRIRCFFGFDTYSALALKGQGKPYLATLALDALCYLLLAGGSLFFLARAGPLFWRRPETWLLLGASVLYAAPYWISMSHPTYHFPVVLPLAVLGLSARRSASERADGWRAQRSWLALLIFAAVQAEWVWQSLRAG